MKSFLRKKQLSSCYITNKLGMRLFCDWFLAYSTKYTYDEKYDRWWRKKTCMVVFILHELRMAHARTFRWPMAHLTGIISAVRWTYNKSACVHVLGSKNSKVKTGRENIVRSFFVSTISPFYVRKTGSLFFVFFCGNMMQYLRPPKGFEPWKSSLKSWSFARQWLPHESSIFWGK